MQRCHYEEIKKIAAISTRSVAKNSKKQPEASEKMRIKKKKDFNELEHFCNYYWWKKDKELKQFDAKPKNQSLD